MLKRFYWLNSHKNEHYSGQFSQLNMIGNNFMTSFADSEKKRFLLWHFDDMWLIYTAIRITLEELYSWKKCRSRKQDLTLFEGAKIPNLNHSYLLAMTLCYRKIQSKNSTSEEKKPIIYSIMSTTLTVIEGGLLMHRFINFFFISHKNLCLVDLTMLGGK